MPSTIIITLIVIFGLIALTIMTNLLENYEKTERQARRDEFGQGQRQAGIEAAQHADKALHLAYLVCYPLAREEKRSCNTKAGKSHPYRSKVLSHIYQNAFDQEAERLGFQAFLEERGMPCLRLDAKPLYQPADNAYRVECEDAENYLLYFDTTNKTWHVVE